MTKLRPHKVLGRRIEGVDIHALSLDEGDFSDIIFVYRDVSFNEDTKNDKLKMKFEYEIIDVPKYREGFDKVQFEKEIGDFLVELLFYGLERDHLGFVDDKYSEDHTIKLDSQ
jgi:hypothetical protein